MNVFLQGGWGGFNCDGGKMVRTSDFAKFPVEKNSESSQTKLSEGWDQEDFDIQNLGSFQNSPLPLSGLRQVNVKKMLVSNKYTTSTER